jgi:hypothetical protein
MGCSELQNVDLASDITGLSLDDHGYILEHTTDAENPGYCKSEHDCSRIKIDPKIDKDGKCRGCQFIYGNKLGICCNANCNAYGLSFPCPILM